VHGAKGIGRIDCGDLPSLLLTGAASALGPACVAVGIPYAHTRYYILIALVCVLYACTTQRIALIMCKYVLSRSSRVVTRLRAMNFIDFSERVPRSSRCTCQDDSVWERACPWRCLHDTWPNGSLLSHYDAACSRPSNRKRAVPNHSISNLNPGRVTIRRDAIVSICDGCRKWVSLLLLLQIPVSMIERAFRVDINFAKFHSRYFLYFLLIYCTSDCSSSHRSFSKIFLD